MKARFAFAAALALATAGCGGSEEGSADRAPTKIVNPYHDQLMGLSPLWQHITLMRAIRDNGNRCRRVQVGRYQEDYRNLALWVALCDDGRYWGVFIAPNGDTQVRQCTQMRQLGLPACRPLTGPGAQPEADTTVPASNLSG